MRSILASMPKIDLHRHLEGSVRPRTLAEICKARQVPLPTYDPDELAPLVRLREPARDLGGFFEPFRTIKFCFVGKEEIARLAFEAVEDACADNVRYLELRFSPEFMAFYHRLTLPEVMDGIVEGVGAARGLPIKVKLIVSISRNLNAETMGMPWPTPEELVRLALSYADRGVVGLDISGREIGFPPAIFEEPFAIARREGLGLTVHAGEETGPEGVREAILLGAARIGHGVRAASDPEVVKLAVDRGVVFEVCPTSNLLSGAVGSLDEHPIRRLYDLHLPVTINTDDPSVCGVTLTDEYALAMEAFGFELADIERMLQNAESAAFGR
ncbi:MAG: adenosine deaminase [Armatimonadota bacterium]